MCDWNDTLMVRVPVPAELSHTGDLRWAEKPVDRCIAPIVTALNAAGILTSGCCCGHGRGCASITLHDGSELVRLTTGRWMLGVPGKWCHAADPGRKFDQVLFAPPSHMVAILNRETQ